MPLQKIVLSICIIAGVTFLTRASPFLIFDKKDRSVPAFVLYLGKYLPPALICIILVYCFRNLNILNGFQMPAVFDDLKELAAVLCVVVLHLWKKNTMLSIFAGTALYMLLQQVF